VLCVCMGWGGGGGGQPGRWREGCGSKCVVRMHMLTPVVLCCAVLPCAGLPAGRVHMIQGWNWSSYKLLSFNSGALRHKPHHAHPLGQHMTAGDRLYACLLPEWLV
jgi:hypothetical protein